MPTAPQTSPPPDWPVVTKTFEKSYSEVLLFLKHQDDKINRVLTALAFLTTAGVTLFVFGRRATTNQQEVEAAREFFPREWGISVADFFFAVFLIGVLFAVIFALAALNPTSHAPKFAAGQRQPSLIHYGSIASLTTEAWDDLLVRSKEDVEEGFARDFHYDAHVLARRAQHKVRRFAETQAFALAATTSLALLGIFRLLPFEMDIRWTIAAVLLAATALSLPWDFYSLRATDFPGTENLGRMWWPLALSLVPLFILLLVSLFEDIRWPAAWNALGSVFLLRFFVHRLTWSNWLAINAVLGLIALGSLVVGLGT